MYCRRGRRHGLEHSPPYRALIFLFSSAGGGPSLDTRPAHEGGCGIVAGCSGNDAALLPSSTLRPSALSLGVVYRAEREKPVSGVLGRVAAET